MSKGADLQGSAPFVLAKAPLRSAQSLGAVVHCLDQPRLDVNALTAMARAAGGVWLTPFEHVVRVPLGHDVAVGDGGMVQVRRWFRPEDAQGGPSSAADADARAMRLLLSKVIAELIPASGVVAVAMSAGLDSTTVAALAARPGLAAVSAFCASPRIGTPDRVAGRPADDWPRAQQMAGPGLEVHRLLNHTGESWLDLAPGYFRRNLAPIAAPRNAWWLAAAERATHQGGARVLLMGTGGNATFSRGAQVRTALGARMGDNPRTTPTVESLRRFSRRGWSGTIAAWRMRRESDRLKVGSSGPRVVIGPPAKLPRHVLNMPPWVRWCLAEPTQAPMGDMTGLPVQIVDPFRDPRVIELAMSLPQSSWTAGGLSRSLARRATEGLLPDDIRLGTTRGHQSADFPDQLLEEADRYEEVIERICQSGTAAQFLDLDFLRESIPLLHGDIASAQQWITHFLKPVSVGYFAAWWDDTGRFDYR